MIAIRLLVIQATGTPQERSLSQSFVEPFSGRGGEHMYILKPTPTGRVVRTKLQLRVFSTSHSHQTPNCYRICEAGQRVRDVDHNEL